ncbi:hypothetical protein LWI28_005045 [Acer negundo]|uniref:Uncharacterized protein n=1 Tax=Acer negundo TaxID=4023 RepID=A0AAD5NL89_ACENE|nr:hypothetical protein LWI28_005045 [Acer negundo]
MMKILIEVERKDKDYQALNEDLLKKYDAFKISKVKECDLIVELEQAKLAIEVLRSKPTMEVEGSPSKSTKISHKRPQQMKMKGSIPYFPHSPSCSNSLTCTAALALVVHGAWCLRGGPSCVEPLPITAANAAFGAHIGPSHGNSLQSETGEISAIIFDKDIIPSTLEAMNMLGASSTHQGGDDGLEGEFRLGLDLVFFLVLDGDGGDVVRDGDGCM